jgi:hypothetical protein
MSGSSLVRVPEMFKARRRSPGLEQKGEGRREVILLEA